MNTPTDKKKTVRWAPSASREVRTTARPKWESIRKGLDLAVYGHAGFAVLLALGGALMATEGGAIALQADVTPDEAVYIGWGLVGLGGALGYALVLASQWRCLVNAQQAHGAKDLLFAALLAWLVWPACFVAAHFCGGAENVAALARGPRGLADVNLLAGGSFLQLAGALIALVSVLLFSGFARAVRRSLSETDRWAAAFFWCVAFLVGGTAGLLLPGHGVLWKDAWPSLAGGWLLCLLWHTLLLHGAASAVERSARRKSGVVPTLAGPHKGSGQIALQNGSFFHRSAGSK